MRGPAIIFTQTGRDKIKQDQLQSDKISAEIAHIMAQTIKLNKDIRWYEVTIIIAVTLAIVALTKLFL